MKHGIEKEFNNKKRHTIVKLFIVLVVLAILVLGGAFVIKYGPNYINHDITDRTNLVINYSNVTGRMKHNLIIDDNGVVYLSMEDIQNYYDKHMYYDKQYDQIVTSSETKLAVLKMNENKITVNGDVRGIKGAAMVKDGVYYLPISEMEDVYNIKISKADNKIIMESLDRKLTTTTSNKKLEVKSKATTFSRTVEKVDKDAKLVIAETEQNSAPSGWARVRTENGNLGYVEEKNLSNRKVEREDYVQKKQINGKISLVWEYFSEYAKAPNNDGVQYDGVNVVSPSFFHLKLEDTKKEKLTTLDVVTLAKFVDNVGDEGVKYIEWAHNNNYKVWPKVSNETLSTTIDEFSYLINDYKLREVMINDILNFVDKYQLDGINLDFEYMYKDDCDAFSKFIIELAPRLRAKGVCLSVDVTAPNGGDNWSLCYDRNLIGEVADYVVFMGYDQYGTSVIGTTSGYNWLESSINNLLGYEAVPPEKIILGLPFYTKLWQTKDGETIKGTAVTMKNIQDSIPASASKEWQENLKQYYVEYSQGVYVYKMWVEDEESFSEKLKLVDQNGLAGAAYWRKGFESQGIWQVIKSHLGV